VGRQRRGSEAAPLRAAFPGQPIRFFIPLLQNFLFKKTIKMKQKQKITTKKYSKERQTTVN
jgi:hypothetical protein